MMYFIVDFASTLFGAVFVTDVIFCNIVIFGVFNFLFVILLNYKLLIDEISARPIN